MMTKAEPDWSVVLSDWVAVVARIFINAWLVMLTFGVLHGSAQSVPAFGYWQCLLAVAVVVWIVWTGTYTLMQRTRTVTPMYGKKQVTVQLDAKAIADALLQYGRKNSGVGLN